jgi:hypothetical protein
MITEYAKFSFLRPFILLAPDVSAGRTATELWQTSEELSPAGIIIIIIIIIIITTVLPSR